MNTSKMRRLENLSVNQTFSMFTQSEDLKKIAAHFFDSMEAVLIHNQIVDALKEYELGTVTEVYEIFGGYVNRSFGIYTEKDGKRSEYFVRKYKYGITEPEIVFEHLMIDYSKEHGLELAAGLIRTRGGSTFVKKSEGSNGNERDIFFAVYEFLEGDDLYTWDTPNLNDEEYASAAGVLASFHNAARDFDPQGLKRVEPKIMDFLPTLPETYISLANKELETRFHKYYTSKLKAILEMIGKSQIPPELVKEMPHTPCHNDFHAGNLKYKDNKVVGLFDFDWSKIDLRLFDVCLALDYCCSSWQDEKDGELLMEKCAIFLRAYQNKLAELGGLEPLNALEREWFPTMMAAANIYLINWDVLAYYAGKDLNEYEYIAYLQHHIRLMIWIENHKAELAELVKSL